MATLNYNDMAKNTVTELNALLTKLESHQGTVSSLIDKIIEKEQKLIKLETAAKKELQEKERQERLRSVLASNEDLAVHVGGAEEETVEETKEKVVPESAGYVAKPEPEVKKNPVVKEKTDKTREQTIDFKARTNEKNNRNTDEKRSMNTPVVINDTKSRGYDKKNQQKNYDQDKKAKNKSEEYDIREECALPEEEGTEDETLFSQEDIVRESVFKDSETSKDTSKESFKDFLLSIVDFVRNIKEKLSKFYNKIIDFKDNFEYYFGVINSNSFNHAFNKCKKEIVKLIKIILPRSVKGKIEFGGKEPSLTGQVYGFFNAFRTGAFRKLKLVPFLEEERFNGHIVIKGHFRIISVLFIAAKVYFNKDIKKTIKLFKRER